MALVLLTSGFLLQFRGSLLFRLSRVARYRFLVLWKCPFHHYWLRRYASYDARGETCDNSTSNLRNRLVGFLSRACRCAITNPIFSTYLYLTGESIIDAQTVAMEAHRKHLNKRFVEAVVDKNGAKQSSSSPERPKEKKTNSLLYDLFIVCVMQLPMVGVVLILAILLGHVEGWDWFDRLASIFSIRTQNRNSNPNSVYILRLLQVQRWGLATSVHRNRPSDWLVHSCCLFPLQFLVTSCPV